MEVRFLPSQPLSYDAAGWQAGCLPVERGSIPLYGATEPSGARVAGGHLGVYSNRVGYPLRKREVAGSSPVTPTHAPMAQWQTPDGRDQAGQAEVRKLAVESGGKRRGLAGPTRSKAPEGSRTDGSEYTPEPMFEPWWELLFSGCSSVAKSAGSGSRRSEVRVLSS